MQDKRRHSTRNGKEQYTCRTCASIGEEIREDWMLPNEHYHKCPVAYASIGLVEENDTACGSYKN